MAVRRLDLYHVALPLKTKVKHASHERTVSDSLVVRVTLEDGTTGFGEGVPRPYVTGETIDSTFATLEELDWSRQVGRPVDFAGLVRRLDALVLPETAADPRGMAGNAARCALELALLDAFGRRFGRTVGDAVRLAGVPGLRVRDRQGSVRYSGAITAASPARERASAWKMWLYGFRQVKLKVGVAGQDDPSRLREVRRVVGPGMDIRVDANEGWPAEGLAERVRPLLPYRPSALEQPVPHAEVDRLAELRPWLGVPVMLDESLCGEPDARRAVERGTADLFNVRLSKCGGLIPSLRIMALAWRSGLGVQLGCHPGETGLLSAAGRHVAANLDGLRYVEGSYDRHILRENLTTRHVSFTYGGRARPIPGPGLGVEVNPAALERLTVRHREIADD